MVNRFSSTQVSWSSTAAVVCPLGLAGSPPPLAAEGSRVAIRKQRERERQVAVCFSKHQVSRVGSWAGSIRSCYAVVHESIRKPRGLSDA